MTKTAAAPDFQKVYDLFFTPGEVTEIRALNVEGRVRGIDRPVRGWTVFGYYDNRDAFADGAAALAAVQAYGVYFTLNPVNPGCLARAANRLKISGRKDATTADKDSALIRWIPLDFDPVRPSGISASADELNAAIQTARDAIDWLTGQGVPAGIKAMSGNGAHYVIRLPDLENAPENQALVKNFLAAMDARFSNDQVKVDISIHNPARILKLPGTKACKGDHTEDRPHRISRLSDEAPAGLAEIAPAPLDLIRKLAERAPESTPAAASKPARARSGQKKSAGADPIHISGKVKLDEYLQSYGVDVRDVETDGGKTIYKLDHCIFDNAHAYPDAAVIQFENGALAYKCFHDSCAQYRWNDFRQAISGDAPLGSFIEGGQGTGQGRAHGGGFQVGDEPIPPPEDVDYRRFFKPPESAGKRPRFMYSYMSDYLEKHLKHVRAAGKGEFWHYRAGVWRMVEDGEIKNIISKALKDEIMPARLTGSLECFRSKVYFPENEWITPKHLINCKSGMIDTTNPSDFKVIPHDPEYNSRCQVQASFDLDVDFSEWTAFLHQIFPQPGGPASFNPRARLLQMFFGYTLLPTCKYEKVLILSGTGSNGKSTCLDTWINVLGEENTAAYSMKTLSENRFAVPELRAKLVNIATESETRDVISTETLKLLASGDMLSGEIKHGSQVTFRSTVKLIFAVNSPPAIKDTSYGLKRKLAVIQFGERFTAANKNPDLKEKFKGDADPVFMWALLGASLLLEQKGFDGDATNAEDAEAFMADLDSTQLFLREYLQEEPGATVSSKEVYDLYRKFMEENGYKARASGKLKEGILERFPHAKHERGYFDTGAVRERGMVYENLRLKTDADHPDPYAPG